MPLQIVTFGLSFRNHWLGTVPIKVDNLQEQISEACWVCLAFRGGASRAWLNYADKHFILMSRVNPKEWWLREIWLASQDFRLRRRCFNSDPLLSHSYTWVAFRALLFELNEVIDITHLLKCLAQGEWNTGENSPQFLFLSRKGTMWDWLVGRLNRQRGALSEVFFI